MQIYPILCQLYEFYLNQTVRVGTPNSSQSSQFPLMKALWTNVVNIQDVLTFVSFNTHQNEWLK